jgi:hypothetical protein
VAIKNAPHRLRPELYLRTYRRSRPALGVHSADATSAAIVFPWFPSPLHYARSAFSPVPLEFRQDAGYRARDRRRHLSAGEPCPVERAHLALARSADQLRRRCFFPRRHYHVAPQRADPDRPRRFGEGPWGQGLQVWSVMRNVPVRPRPFSSFSIPHPRRESRPPGRIPAPRAPQGLPCHDQAAICMVGYPPRRSASLRAT